MPYIFEARNSGSIVAQGASSLGAGFLDVPSRYDAVYSYRSGETSEDSVTPGPSSQDNVLDRIFRRRAQVESAANALVRNGPSDRYLLMGDQGHEFAVMHAKIRTTDSRAVFQKTSSVSSQCTIVNGCPSSMLLGSAWIPGIPPFQGGYFRSKGDTVADGATHLRYMGNTQVTGSATEHLRIMSPVQSQASVLQTILELCRGDVPRILVNIKQHLDGISRLRVRYKTLKDATKYGGKEYLNIQFGWAPVIQDVSKALALLGVIDKLIYVPESTRRRRTSVISRNANSASDYVQWGMNYPLCSNLDSSIVPRIAFNKRYGYLVQNFARMTTEFTSVETLDLRTTARFASPLRAGSAANGYADRASELLGTEITPALLWELTPWSWLIDWFTNIGSVFENLSNLALNQIILNYAYSTVRYRVSQTAYGHPQVTTSGSGVKSYSGNFIHTREFDFKRRFVASPYGFSSSIEGLSAFQWSILVALGLARQR